MRVPRRRQRFSDGVASWWPRRRHYGNERPSMHRRRRARRRGDLRDLRRRGPAKSRARLVESDRMTVNGKHVDLDEPMTIAEFLAKKNLHAKIVVVERNREIVPRERYGDVVLGGGDELEIVQMMAGG